MFCLGILFHCFLFVSFFFFLIANSFFFKFYFYLLIWLGLVLAVACRIFSCGMWTLSCRMEDLVPWLGIKPRPPALGVQCLSHWTTKVVNSCQFFILFFDHAMDLVWFSSPTRDWNFALGSDTGLPGNPLILLFNVPVANDFSSSKCRKLKR